MKQHRRFFSSDRRTNNIIEQVISKITQGEFHIENLEWNRNSASDEAKVTVKINGTSPMHVFGSANEDMDGETNTSSASTEETSLRPDEKEIQEQVANCYL